MAEENKDDWKKTVEGVIGHVQLFLDADPTRSFTPSFVSQMLQRFRDAHNSEVAELKRQREEALTIVNEVEKCASIERHTEAMLKKNGVIASLRKEVAELRECLREAITQYCTSRPHEYDDGFGNCENFKNGSCASSECWRLDCINKWRKALEGKV